MSVILPKVSKLSKSVIRILGCNPSPLTLQGTNTYIIGTGKERLLLDVGDGEQREYFFNLKKSLNFDRFRISDLLITHWHNDHIGGVPKFLKDVQGGCPVHKFARRDPPDEKMPEGITMGKVVDGQEFRVDGATLKVVHTPGHTNDHIILYHEEENAVFSGDLILGEGTTTFEDLHDFMKSLNKILELKPKKIYPGHGPVIDDPIERIEFYIQHRNEREKQIYQTLAENPDKKMKPIDIVKIIYTETPEVLHAAAATNVEHHLLKLVKDGKIYTQGKVGERTYHFDKHLR